MDGWRMLDAGMEDWAIATAMVDAAQRMRVEIRRAEIEALGKTVAAEVARLFRR